MTRTVRPEGGTPGGRPVDTVTMWLIIVAIGVLSVIGLWIYDRVVVKDKKEG